VQSEQHNTERQCCCAKGYRVVLDDGYAALKTTVN